MNVLIPPSSEQLAGPFVTVDQAYFDVLAARDNVVIIEFQSLPPGVTWFETSDFLYCQRQHDPEIVKVIRKATEEDLRLFRIPLWIQGESIPKCCGQPMYFVGQIDDDYIRMERPEGATMWWHDAASFYVFTCSQCLACKAVGQQF